MESGWRGNNIGGGVGNEDSADMVHQTLFQKKGVTSSDQRKGTLGGVGAEVVSCPTRLSSIYKSTRIPWLDYHAMFGTPSP